MGKSEEEKTDNDYKDGAVTKNALQVITIIGEIEGHDNLPATSKATKYEHMLPKLAEIEMDKDIKGVLFIMNTVGGDVSAGCCEYRLFIYCAYSYHDNTSCEDERNTYRSSADI